MGSGAAKCISKPPATPAATPNTDMRKSGNLSDMHSLSSSSENPWVGEWTYIIKNQVHSFDITERGGKLMYIENMGSTRICGLVRTKEGSHSARIIAKEMKFEIDLNRETMVARYRTLGSKKWTKEIDLMKVDEIADVGTDAESLTWNKSTLRNTWNNTARSALGDDDNGGFLQRDNSMRGCSVRKANSMRYYTQNTSHSTTSTDVEDLFNQNSTRRSLRFADEIKNELIQDLLNEVDSDKES